MNEQRQTIQRRHWRKARTRARIGSRAARPRLSIFRSNQAIYAQIVDASGKVLAAADSLKTKAKTKTEAARQVGENIAKLAITAGITEVVFDRGAYQYHGRVRALADAVREQGLSF
ncbi:TPA: 50S ribosomal protein L18 [Patescibacteria group bacterium]|uniref:Large ribosomal subunit protein uL18 n=2 Tax=Bacteria division Kazan-3B-28 TaxID=1798534 RepID=A0A0G1X7C3_UNCK3|nr:MAG: 50S ribosomal protein L18, large subunit ribosomal protein L18 [candidate division Kazan bacterium GW2011_GWA1_50_15]KKW25414.1 MAG: 50S ribosomal protein L18 [candidate division Kazan bacterium GW2011_GWC1_52_13]KKW26720.1 MAG: 50S ribosomal protein L18 [candidate division Kazan bacterium GW2011_GWB1_52_7]HAV65717.1 50S ribosomal protein L18 [Patescibacteria group bacterium]HCL47579.1 50S ribosomal protein L18 [Patescibacteria group bacterium]